MAVGNASRQMKIERVSVTRSDDSMLGVLSSRFRSSGSSLVESICLWIALWISVTSQQLRNALLFSWAPQGNSSRREPNAGCCHSYRNVWICHGKFAEVRAPMFEIRRTDAIRVICSCVTCVPDGLSLGTGSLLLKAKQEVIFVLAHMKWIT